MIYDYYYGQQSEQFSFYRIPKALFDNDEFDDLSTDAKLLYGIMLDRMSCLPGTTSRGKRSSMPQPKTRTRGDLTEACSRGLPPTSPPRSHPRPRGSPG